MAINGLLIKTIDVPKEQIKRTTLAKSLYYDKIEITRKGFFGLLNQGLKGTKTIPIAEIKSIQLKSAGFTAGYIQFGIGGGVENRGGLQAANRDENTVRLPPVRRMTG